MGAVFAVASAGQGTGEEMLTSLAAARGMQVTFETATVMALIALILAVGSARAAASRAPLASRS